MGRWKHRLSNIRKEQLCGDCSFCGSDIKLRKINPNRYRCADAVNEYNRSVERKQNHYARYGLKTIPLVPKNCEVCDSNKKICYDHDHTTGKHRGWLCDRCNRVLGAAHDDPKLLRGLAKYLEK